MYIVHRSSGIKLVLCTVIPIFMVIEQTQRVTAKLRTSNKQEREANFSFVLLCVKEYIVRLSLGTGWFFYNVLQKMFRVRAVRSSGHIKVCGESIKAQCFITAAKFRYCLLPYIFLHAL